MQEGTFFCIFAFMISGRRIFIVFFAFALFPLTAYAGGGAPDGQKHCFRIGWGDMMYEHAVYTPTAKHIFEDSSKIPENYRVKELYGHRFIGHFFFEYQYRFNGLFSLGAQFDYSDIAWQSGIFDRTHTLVKQEPDTRYSRFAFMPTARVTYFQNGPVSLYSGLGAGVLLTVSNNTEAAFAFNLNLIGIQVGAGHWYGALDLGLMNAFSGETHFYKLGSRLISLSINYAW